MARVLSNCGQNAESCNYLLTRVSFEHSATCLFSHPPKGSHCESQQQQSDFPTHFPLSEAFKLRRPINVSTAKFESS
jgi:hypothetical protein